MVHYYVVWYGLRARHEVLLSMLMNSNRFSPMVSIVCFQVSKHYVGVPKVNKSYKVDTIWKMVHLVVNDNTASSVFLLI